MARLNRKALDRDREARMAVEPLRSIVEVGRQGLLNAVVAQDGPEAYAREISRLWGEARDKFIAIGEYLSVAKRSLAHGDYEEMIRSLLPFGPSAARKMRAVAAAVQEGKLSVESLPNSYATAYELTLLSEDEFRAAEGRGLVRPDVFLREIQALRAEMRAPVGSQRQLALRRERERIIRDIERLHARAREIALELGNDDAEGTTTIIGKAEVVD